MDLSEILVIIKNSIAVFIVVIVYTRLFGLRSFSKMSNFDFAITIAIGSLIASTITNTDKSMLYGLIALLLMYILKIGFAFLRTKSNWVKQASSNAPILLMQNGTILHEVMQKENITEEELIAKLREANVLRMHEVKAVVLETTGDISVLHGEKDVDLEDVLLTGVSNASLS